LLFYSAGRHLAQHQSQEFKSALKMIESKYHPQLGRVHLDIINSSNSSYLKSYVQARHITDVMIPVNYHFKLVDKSSFDLVSLFSELKPDKHELNWGVSKSSASDGVNYLGGMFEDFDMILQPGK